MGFVKTKIKQKQKTQRAPGDKACVGGDLFINLTESSRALLGLQMACVITNRERRHECKALMVVSHCW